MSDTTTNTLQPIEVPADIDPHLFNSPFILALCRIDTGDFVRGLSEDLSALTKATLSIGKKAELQVTLTGKPFGVSESGYPKMLLFPKVKLSLPKPEPKGTALFVAGNQQLLPFDPQQRELPLKALKFEQPAVKAPVDRSLPVKPAATA